MVNVGGKKKSEIQFSAFKSCERIFTFFYNKLLNYIFCQNNYYIFSLYVIFTIWETKKKNLN